MATVAAAVAAVAAAIVLAAAAVVEAIERLLNSFTASATFKHVTAPRWRSNARCAQQDLQISLQRDTRGERRACDNEARRPSWASRSSRSPARAINSRPCTPLPSFGSRGVQDTWVGWARWERRWRSALSRREQRHHERPETPFHAPHGSQLLPQAALPPVIPNGESVRASGSQSGPLKQKGENVVPEKP